jgi:hypothetical protein
MTIPSIAQRRADFIELIARQEHTDSSAESGFNMAAETHLCGSPCCLEGFAHQECENLEIPILGRRAIASLLCIGNWDSDRLYWGTFSDKSRERITPAEAVAALRSIFAKHPVEGDAS